jgi:hypothetical protein
LSSGFSSLQDKPIVFDCDTLSEILGISNEDPRVFKVKVIRIIEGFVYDDAIVLHTGRYDFSLREKIKNQYLLLRPRILVRIIA